MLYYGDRQQRRIVAVNVTTGEGDIVFNGTDEDIYSLAASGKYVYFTAWNKKLVLYIVAHTIMSRVLFLPNLTRWYCANCVYRNMCCHPAVGHLTNYYPNISTMTVSFCRAVFQLDISNLTNITMASEPVFARLTDIRAFDERLPLARKCGFPFVVVPWLSQAVPAD